MAGNSIRTCCERNRILLLHPLQSWLVFWREKECASGSDRTLSNGFKSTLLKNIGFKTDFILLKKKNDLYRCWPDSAAVDKKKERKGECFWWWDCSKTVSTSWSFQKGKGFSFFLETVNTTCAFFDVFNCFEI